MTAVEWLIMQLPVKIRVELYEKNIHEQALQMEEERMNECWNVARQAGRFEGKGIAEENWQTFKQYYNETYNK